MDVPFGPLQPDRGVIAAPMLVVDGVLPTPDGYAPFPSLYVPSTATALPGPPMGVFSVVLNSNAWEAFGFTASAFYQLQSDYTWGAAIASGYALPLNYDWSALSFGTKLLFTNTADGLKSYDVELPAGVTSIAAAGNPAWIFSCANFIVALNCLDSNGNRDARLIKTSGFNDQTNWTTDGADYQELADGGNLLCGFDLKNNTALLVQQRAFVVMQFGNIGGGAQFSLQKVSDGKGAVGARSCVSFDGMVFGLSTNGFFRFDLASGLQYIGAGEIDQAFLAAVDQGNFQLVQGALNPLQNVVVWRYKRNIDSSTTVSEVAIGYHWLYKKWFTITEQTTALARLATVAVTYNTVTGTYDSQTLAYDDLFFTGSAPLFGALDENYKFGLWTGQALAATLTTGVRNSKQSQRVRNATPITDAAAPTITLRVSDKLNQALTTKTAASPSRSGSISLRGRGHNIQVQLNIPAADPWTFADGIDHIDGTTQGAN